MAISKAVIASLLVSLLIFHLVEADNHEMASGRKEGGVARTRLNEGGVARTHLNEGGVDRTRLNEGGVARTRLEKIDGAAACNGRCRLSLRQRLCERGCRTCC